VKNEVWRGEGLNPKSDFKSTKEINPAFCNAICKPSDGWKFYSLRTDYNFNDPSSP